jgi:hypothetical protein
VRLLKQYRLSMARIGAGENRIAVARVAPSERDEIFLHRRMCAHLATHREMD